MKIAFTNGYDNRCVCEANIIEYQEYVDNPEKTEKVTYYSFRIFDSALVTDSKLEQIDADMIYIYFHGSEGFLEELRNLFWADLLNAMKTGTELFDADEWYSNVPLEIKNRNTCD
jgi:hypothetical protein